MMIILQPEEMSNIHVEGIEGQKKFPNVVGLSEKCKIFLSKNSSGLHDDSQIDDSVVHTTDQIGYRFQALRPNLDFTLQQDKWSCSFSLDLLLCGGMSQQRWRQGSDHKHALLHSYCFFFT